jgi:DNA-binding SARP family transcriptional activator
LETRIQVCGRLIATLEGRRIEGELPGRKGRLLFAYLVDNRLRFAPRSELIDAVCPEGLPGSPDSTLSALVSKVRRIVGKERLEGRHELRLVLGDDAWIDAEAAGSALHRAEAAHVRADWPAVWVAARVVQHIAVRPFLAGEDAPASWVEQRRRQLEGSYLRALELATHACLRIGGGELDTAERSARALVRRAPFHESGYRYLMEVLAARNNYAEALQVYDGLRVMLRDELGAVPSPASQALHRTLLGSVPHQALADEARS